MAGWETYDPNPPDDKGFPWVEAILSLGFMGALIIFVCF